MKKKVLCMAGIVMSLCLALDVFTVVKPETVGATTGNARFYDESKGDNLMEENADDFDYSQITAVEYPVSGSNPFEGTVYDENKGDNLMEENVDDFDYSKITAVEYSVGSRSPFASMVYDESKGDNLMEENADDFDYSQITAVEYPVSGSNPFADMLEINKPENHVLGIVKGSYAPTSYWDLLNNPYQFTLVNMQNYAYTDYYFAPDSNNNLAIDFGTLTVVGDYFTIKLYETISQNCVGTWTGSRQENYGLGWTNLNPNKTYYIKFEAYSGAVNGTGFIMYD